MIMSFIRWSGGRAMTPLTPEQQEELQRTFAASFARNEAMEAERRKREGGVALLLERASDDPQENEPAFQEELGAFTTSLLATGLTYSQRGMAFDTVDGGGYPLPEFVIDLGPAVIAATAAVCGAWVTARYGRKVRLKIGDVEAEGRTAEEIEGLLTPERRTVAYEIIRRATDIWRRGIESNLHPEDRDRFEAAMTRDGQEPVLVHGHELGTMLASPESVPLTLPPNNHGAAMTRMTPVTRRVFVVHGRDEAALHAVARFLEQLDLEAIVLREEPDKGRTVIEKFEPAPPM
jgi:hypothetical protein